MINRAKAFLERLAAMSENEVSHFFIGAGSTREAYTFEENYIIKIPRFVVRFEEAPKYGRAAILNIIKRGVAQTKTEIRVYDSCNDNLKYLLNPVIAHGHFLNMPFVVMPKIKIASKLVPFDVGTLKEFIRWNDLCVPMNFHIELSRLSNKYNLYLSDLQENMDNFGLDSCNRLIITDYGTRRGVNVYTNYNDGTARFRQVN